MDSAGDSRLLERAVTAALGSSGVIAISYGFVEESPARILWLGFGLVAILVAVVGRRSASATSALKLIPPRLARFLAIFVPTIVFLAFTLYTIMGASGFLVGMTLPTSLLLLIAASTVVAFLNLVILLINLRHLHRTR
ncbi:MAG TPA: hypothetical protein VJK02_05655 [Anaerolineales bacterium]|nr:hypothetical protein [Anaerolineales bacterium]